ncbi:MAG: hypothetical protein U5K36_01775, partial [Roseovarius sp.]|nr:hypothetical protein [Roseovarius sp.]
MPAGVGRIAAQPLHPVTRLPRAPRLVGFGLVRPRSGWRLIRPSASAARAARSRSASSRRISATDHAAAARPGGLLFGRALRVRRGGRFRHRVGLWRFGRGVIGMMLKPRRAA